MKKIVSCDVQLVVRLLDNDDATVFDGFKSLNEAIDMANFYNMEGDGDVWWIDEHITFDDGSVLQNRHYVPDLS